MKRKIIVDVCCHCPYVVHYVISNMFGCRKMKVDFVVGFDIMTNLPDECPLPYSEESIRDRPDDAQK